MKSEFEITVLGNTSSIPAYGRNHTSQVVRLGNEWIMMDCGEGTQIQLRRFKIKYSRINHIVISHLHGDHYLGLIGLLSSYHLAKRTRDLYIYGPKGLDEIITTNFRWSNTQLSYPIHFKTTRDEGLDLLVDHPTFSLYSFPLKHRLPTTGFLVREKKRLRNLIKHKIEEKKPPLEAILSLRNGKDFVGNDEVSYTVREFCLPEEPIRSYAFCSDTIYWPQIQEFIQGVDLLYHESTFTESEKERAAMTFHSTAAQAAQIAQDSGVKKLLLGHFSSRYRDLSTLLEEAKSIFPNSELSQEGATYSL